MIRDEVIFWGAAVLLVVFAFILMPAHERFKDAQGRETDVSPDAPPKPEWLKPINERTGKREGFWSSLTSFFTPTREKMTTSTLTMVDLYKAGAAFIHKLASNETNPLLKTQLESLADLSISVDNTPIPPVFVPLYKLYTSSYSSLGEIAAAANLPKPTTPNEVIQMIWSTIFSISAAPILFPNSSTSSAQTSLPRLSGVTAQQSGTPPQFTTDSTLGSTTGTTGMEPTSTQGYLRTAQITFIQLLIGNEPDQATKLGLTKGLATLQELARSASTSVQNVPLGSADKRVYEILTGGFPSSYTYKQFEYAFQSAGGTNASPENIVNMVQSIPSNFNPLVTPRRTVSNVSQMSQMDALVPPDLYGPGPNVLRSALQSCTCASQTSGCPKHG
uniref:Uncharacterized protein n=1 Tax=viral metagenome TaxID=1070528 RepID=A0A6C0AIR1_9ZZZZ